jgi:hypothetical protein
MEQEPRGRPEPHDGALLIVVIQEDGQDTLRLLPFLLLTNNHILMASHTISGLLGLDRTKRDADSGFHPNNFPHHPSVNVPSTASRSSGANKKVHFNGESVAESSGTQPTSVSSAYAPKRRQEQANLEMI